MQNINPVSPHPIVLDMQKRISNLEDNQREALKESAVRTTEIALISKDVKDIKEDVSSLHKGISKVIWTIVGTALSTAVGVAITYVLTGGFS